MTRDKNRLVISKDITDKFKEYYAKEGNGAWGSLHIVLEDKNVDNDDVEFCKQYAQEKGDTDGVELADILLKFTKTQRRKLSNIC